MPLTLSLLPDTFAVCRLEHDAEIPQWARTGEFFSITRTGDELSVVCRDADVPDGIRCERGWRALKVHGPLDFALIGILAALAQPLTNAGISLFAISTCDTDYALVKEKNLENAIAVLKKEGHQIV